MKTPFVPAILAILAAAVAATAPTQYRAHCGMVYTATQAKKAHYVCPMDHLKMVPIVPIKAAGSRPVQRGGK